MAKDVLDDVKLTDHQKEVAKKVYDTAKDMGVDPELALATAWTENQFRDKTSPAGAIGIMQIMPKTAKAYGVDLKHLSHPDVNIGLGIRILKDNLERHKGDPTLALVTYNTTTRNVNKFIKANKDPSVLPKETQDYLQRIGEHYDLSGKAEEKSPFDEEPQAQGNDEPSIFGSKEQAPSWMFEDTEQAPKETTLLQDVFGAAENMFGAANRAPGVVLPTMGAAYPAARIQSSFNEGAEDVLNRKAPTVADIEQNYGARKIPLEQEFAVKQAERDAVLKQLRNPPEYAGDKWSVKTVGELGPGGESTAEAARNYRLQKGLTQEGVGAQWRPNREGMILPTPMAQQQESDRAARELAMREEQARLLNAQGQRERSVMQDRAASIDAEKQRLIDEAIKRQSPLNRLGMTTGRFMTTNPAVTGLFQAPAGYFANEARERAQRGDILGSAISSVKAVGAEIGGLPMSPRYKPLMMLKGAGQGAALLGIGADYLRRKLGYDPEYKPYKK